MEPLDSITQDTTIISNAAPTFFERVQDYTSTEFAFWMSAIVESNRTRKD